VILPTYVVKQTLLLTVSMLMCFCHSQAPEEEEPGPSKAAGKKAGMGLHSTHFTGILERQCLKIIPGMHDVDWLESALISETFAS
jgi:hypothetical protein